MWGNIHWLFSWNSHKITCCRKMNESYPQGTHVFHRLILHEKKDSNSLCVSCFNDLISVCFCRRDNYIMIHHRRTKCAFNLSLYWPLCCCSLYLNLTPFGFLIQLTLLNRHDMNTAMYRLVTYSCGQMFTDTQWTCISWKCWIPMMEWVEHRLLCDKKSIH